MESRKCRRGKKKHNENINDGRSGFMGKTAINLKLSYMNGTEKWPVSHILSKPGVTSEDILQDIMKQNVGVNMNDDVCDYLSELKILLGSLVRNHKNMLPYSRLLKYYIVRDSVKTDKPFPPSFVLHYLRNVIRRVVPSNLLGVKHNWKKFDKFLARICCMAKFQTFALHTLLNGHAISKVIWLKSIQGHGLKQHIYAKVVQWIITQYVQIILQINFNVTDSSSGKYQLQFYWKRTWQKTTQKALNNMVKIGKIERFTSNLPKEVFTHAMVPNPGTPRFLPKSTGTRLILPIRTETSKHDAEDALSLLETLLKKEIQENNIKEVKDFKEVWHNLHCHWVNNGCPKLYFVRLDIADAYGSVNHDMMIKVLKILQKKWLPKDGYLKLSILHLRYMDPKHRVKFHAHFENLTPKVTGYTEFHVVHEKMVNTRYLLGLVRRYLKWQTMKCFGHMYRLKHGLAQGFRLSPVLCKLYLRSMDTQYLKKLAGGNNLLVCAVDDYLYVTPNQDFAERFVKIMKSGIPEYGLKINNRMETNLYDNIDKISFSGYLLHVGSLKVEGDYGCYQGHDLKYSIRINYKSKPGNFLQKRLMGLSTVKLHSMLLDEELNSFDMILKNIFHSCLLLAFRFHAISQIILIQTKNQQFLKKCIHKVAIKVNKTTYYHLKRNETEDMSRYKLVGQWLTYAAFQLVLNKHTGSYAQVLHDLKFLMKYVNGKISSDLHHQLCDMTKGIPSSLKGIK